MRRIRHPLSSLFHIPCDLQPSLMFHACVLARLSTPVKNQENQKPLGVEERVYVAALPYPTLSLKEVRAGTWKHVLLMLRS